MYDASDLLHFATTEDHYERDLGQNKRREHLRLFVWESDPIGGSGVAYDDHDEITLPRNHRSKRWFDEAVNTDLTDLCLVHHAWHHYYIVHFGCSIDPK